MSGYTFTQRVRTILELSREAAQPWRHEYVDTEHMLLGIIAEGHGVAAAVLQNLGIDLTGLKTRVESALKPGGSAFARFLLGPRATGPTGPDLPYAHRAKKVLELAMVEARDLSHGYVGSEHLLIALLRIKRGVAARALTAVGASVDTVRQETLRLHARPS